MMHHWAELPRSARHHIKPEWRQRALHLGGRKSLTPDNTFGMRALLYLALTMLAHHQVMKTRDNMSAVIEGLQRERGLLAAYLEAIAETPKLVNVEAHRVSAAPRLPEVVRSTSPFVFRRAGCEHY